jgi:hypothetical protein
MFIIEDWKPQENKDKENIIIVGVPNINNQQKECAYSVRSEPEIDTARSDRKYWIWL